MLAGLDEDTTITARSDASRRRPFPVAISLAEGAALRAWVTAEGCRRTIEIGLAFGVSSLCICAGLLASAGVEGSHLAIDPFEHSAFGDVGLQLLEDAGVRSMVDHRSERSELVLPALVAAGEHFDLAFVDGSHHFDAVFVDLFYLGRLVRPRGIVMLDDHQVPSVARAAAFFVGNLGWTVEQRGSSPNHDWVVLRTNARRVERPFGHFVDF